MQHEILSTTTVFTGRAFDVEVLRVRLPDARERDYNLVHHPDSVTIVPIDHNGDIWFVTQYRMGSRSILLELPAGVLDGNESPQTCAAREIREEIGMAAGKLQHLGSNYLVPGYSTEINHVFLATDLVNSPLTMDEDEFLGVKKIPWAEMQALVSSGSLQDSKSIAALYLARPLLEGTGDF